MPPKPLTILLGFVSLKFGYNAPRPTASAFSTKVITVTVAAKNAVRAGPRCSSVQDSNVSTCITTSVAAVAHQNLSRTTATSPSGARPTTHTRFPSSENCGNTNRVVIVARFSAQAPRFR